MRPVLAAIYGVLALFLALAGLASVPSLWALALWLLAGLFASLFVHLAAVPPPDPTVKFCPIAGDVRARDG